MPNLNAKLVRSEALTEDVFHYDFEVTEGELVFKPGQFCMLKVEDGDKPVNRAYSIASLPSMDGKSFSLNIKLVPGGRGSEFLRGKKEGDEMSFMGPFGHFFLREDEESLKKDIVMVATGTGVAPFMSMLPHLFELGYQGKVTLLFGVRYKQDLFYVDQLREWEAQHENFHPVISLSRPEEDWEGDCGRVTDHLAETGLSNGNTKLYICGNGAMVKDVRAQALEMGVDKTDIHLEQYTPA